MKIQDLKHLPQDEQIHAVKDALRNTSEDVSDWIDSDELVQWLKDNKERILELANTGEV